MAREPLCVRSISGGCKRPFGLLQAAQRPYSTIRQRNFRSLSRRKRDTGDSRQDAGAGRRGRREHPDAEGGQGAQFRASWRQIVSGNITRRGIHSWRLKFEGGERDTVTGNRRTRYVTVRGTKKDAQ